MRERLYKLIGKEVIINSNFTYQPWRDKPFIFSAQDFKTVIDIFNSYSYIISINDGKEYPFPIINIWRY